MANSWKLLKRKGTFDFDRNGRILVYVSAVLLLFSGALNLTLLNRQSHSLEQDNLNTKQAVDCSIADLCPAINCSQVCARAQYNDLISSRKEEIFSESKVSQSSSAQGKETKLDDTLLFVGIISGRGYRCSFAALIDAPLTVYILERQSSSNTVEERCLFSQEHYHRAGNAASCDACTGTGAWR